MTPIRVPQQPRRTAIRVTASLVSLPSPFARQGPGPANAQASFPQDDSVELDQILFVQAPEHDNSNGGGMVAWIPEPIQRSCLCKTLTQCSAIDYCIRTTSK